MLMLKQTLSLLTEQFLPLVLQKLVGIKEQELWSRMKEQHTCAS